jgi:hypothetical protein
MAGDREALRDWHRLFGLLLTDFFTGSPFAVEVERDLSVQQQFLDVVIVRRRAGRFRDRLPDGLEGLAAHNLITFKSYHEALDAWAIKELVAHDVAYRKLVSPSPAELLPEGRFRLFAVCARRPQRLPRQVPWRRRQPGVYDCRWGTDTIRVVVAAEVSLQPHHAPLHLFSAAPDLVGFGRRTYRRHSEFTSGLLDLLFGRYREEGLIVPYTMQDFMRDYIKERLPELPREEREDVLRSLPLEERLAGIPPEERLAGIPPEERLAGLPPEQIRQFLDRLTAGQEAPSRKPRRKK